MITKVEFSADNAAQSLEMFDFLNTYATDYFDNITRNSSTGDIACSIHLGYNQYGDELYSSLTFNYHSYVGFCNVIYTTNARSSQSPTLQWDTYGQVPIGYAYVTDKGFCLQISKNGKAYQGFLWVFISKGKNGNTYLFMPQMSYPSLTPRWINMHVPDNYGSSGGFNYETGAYTFTNSAKGVSLAPIVTTGNFEYLPYIWRVIDTPYLWSKSTPLASIGKMTMNGVTFVTNGYIALQDSDGYEEYAEVIQE